MWAGLAVWTIVLCALAAKAEDSVTISAADRQALLTAFDKRQKDVAVAQKSIAEYESVKKKVTEKYKLPEGTDYSVGLADCATLAGGAVKCNRSVTPIIPKPKVEEPKK